MIVFIVLVPRSVIGARRGQSFCIKCRKAHIVLKIIFFPNHGQDVYDLKVQKTNNMGNMTNALQMVANLMNALIWFAPQLFNCIQNLHIQCHWIVLFPCHLFCDLINNLVYHPTPFYILVLFFLLKNLSNALVS